MQAVIENAWPKPILRSPWRLTGLLAIATLLLLLIHPYSADTDDPSVPLALRASEREGQLTVQWDPLHPAVKRAHGATIGIEEDGRVVLQPLTRDALRAGSFTCTRTSKDLQLTLTLLRDEQPSASSLVRSVGP